MAAGTPQLSVVRTRDGVWSVNERGPSRTAVSYFPTKWGALKHAVRAARAKPAARVAVLHPDGAEEAAREYRSGPGGANVEIR